MTNVAAFSATLTLVAAGAMTGVFFAFSVAVMPGLDAVGPERAVAAMRSINDTIVNPVFLAAFLGTPLAAAVTGGLLLAAGHRPAGAAFLAAAGIYLLGALMPTFIVNVPMNDTLAASGAPDGPAHAARLWAGYCPRWTTWNTARGAAAALSLLLAALGTYLWGRDG